MEDLPRIEYCGIVDLSKFKPLLNSILRKRFGSSPLHTRLFKHYITDYMIPLPNLIKGRICLESLIQKRMLLTFLVGSYRHKSNGLFVKLIPQDLMRLLANCFSIYPSEEVVEEEYEDDDYL